jgi:hypothetical protein
MHGTPGPIALWPLALLAGLLPMAAALSAMLMSMQQGLVPACNPFTEGCVSVSRAARHGLPNLVFQALMVPGATLQALVWCLAARWLQQPGHAHGERGVSLLMPLGVVAGMALVVYATFLGTEGPVYRWLRQYGTVVYFGFTCLCLLLLGRAVLARHAASALMLPRWQGRAVMAMAVALPLLGVGNAIVAAAFDDAFKARVENLTEWWGSLIFVLGFFLISAMWHRAGVAMHLTSAASR